MEEEEVFAGGAEVLGAEDSLLGAVTVAVTGAVDEVTPLTRTKEVFLQTRDPPRATDWVVSFLLVSTLRRKSLSFLAIKTEIFFFPFSVTYRILFLFLSFPSFFFFLESSGGFFSLVLFLTARLTKDIRQFGWYN